MDAKAKLCEASAQGSPSQRTSDSLLTKNMAAWNELLIVNSALTDPSASLGYFLLLIKTASVAFKGEYAP